MLRVGELSSDLYDIGLNPTTPVFGNERDGNGIRKKVKRVRVNVSTLEERYQGGDLRRVLKGQIVHLVM